MLISSTLLSFISKHACKKNYSFLSLLVYQRPHNIQENCFDNDYLGTSQDFNRHPFPSYIIVLSSKVAKECQKSARLKPKFAKLEIWSVFWPCDYLKISFGNHLCLYLIILSPKVKTIRPNESQKVEFELRGLKPFFIHIQLSSNETVHLLNRYY